MKALECMHRSVPVGGGLILANGAPEINGWVDMI